MDFSSDLLCRLNSPCTSLLHYQKHDAFVNVEEEIVKLEEELKYTQGFLVGVTKKLSNERFVANAPEAVVTSERKKMSDAEGKIALITQRLEALKG